MSDIVDRLKAPAYWISGSVEGHEGENDAPREAAAEITALRAERDALKNEKNSHANRMRATEMRELREAHDRRLKVLNEKAEEARNEWTRAERAEAERDALKARLAEAVEVMKPFADEAKRLDRPHQFFNGSTISPSDNCLCPLTIRLGYLRAAAAFIASVDQAEKAGQS